MILEIIVLILSIAFLLIALFSVFLLLQIRKTAEAVTEALRTLTDNLPRILSSLEEMIVNINQVSCAASRHLEDLTDSFKKMQSTIAVLTDLGRLIQEGVQIPFLGTLTSLMPVLKGVRVFLRVLNAKSAPGKK